ncbi:glycoside hydrolase family protein [Deminuibacter soli]|uniref:hypothetical protein n=1 Tax=Deminuibacter soli TaxID=2291815 RepID=UPI001B88009C|nr:hypothetical protein [Deminuibacter soli]
MKNNNAAIMVLATALLCTGLFTSCKKTATPAAGENTTQRSVLATNGFGNGVNLQPSYYNGGNPNFGWSLMKQQTKIKTVRIEIEPGYVTQAKSWISQARSNGYAVIATYHNASVLGSDNTNDLNAAANWWVSNYATLASAGSFTINLMNEWGSHNLTANAYASAYNTAMQTVRRVYSGAIIIDVPGWGQETAIAAAAAKGYNGGTKISDGNYILSAHIYPGSWNQAKNRYVNTSDIDDLASAGKPCMLGEFGNSGGSGADWSAIVDYARNKGWTVLAWAWNGDGGSMNMVTPSWASNGGATSFSLSSYFNVAYAKL